MRKIAYQFMSALATLALALLSFQSVSALPSASPLSASSTYYVSPSGSDTGTCTASAPCETFKKVMSVAQAGSTIIVLPGTYNQKLTISKSDMTVEGQNAIIDTTESNGIVISANVENIVVRGFTVTRTRSHSVLVFGKYVIVENTIVYHSVLENGSLSNGEITCYNNRWGSGLKAEKGSSNVTFRGNTVYETCGEGIAATLSNNVLIENNTIYDNHNVNIYVDNTYSAQVLNNYAYCTGKTSNDTIGIALGEESYSGGVAQLHDVTIHGNKVENCYAGIMAFSSQVGGTLTNVTFSSNFVPSSQSKGLALDNRSNSNVSITGNTYHNEPWIRNKSGVTLSNNVVGTELDGDTLGTTFIDVPQSHWAWQYIESIYDAGITGGCVNTPLSYCPAGSVTRAQMAIFLLRGIHGSSYSPPSVGSDTGFDDVPVDYWAATWIKQLAAEGITGGCGNGDFCPDRTVTRDQMAVFLLKAKYGADYAPPSVGSDTGFTDVSSNHWAAAWIKQLASEAITGGCGGSSYCPSNAVTRDQMAAFLQRTFGLALP
ncbi:MAG: S-layer homology domain-containing protein [Anaerolineales bacterium]|nr:S-layer homology domain-containing protein [Anaerolineales bacterium]